MKRPFILAVLLLAVLPTISFAGDHGYPHLAFRFYIAVSAGVAEQHIDEYGIIGVGTHFTLVDVPLSSSLTLNMLGAGAAFIVPPIGPIPEPWENHWTGGTVTKIPLLYFTGRKGGASLGMWYGTNRLFHPDAPEKVDLWMLDYGVGSRGWWFW